MGHRFRAQHMEMASLWKDVLLAINHHCSTLCVNVPNVVDLEHCFSSSHCRDVAESVFLCLRKAWDVSPDLLLYNSVHD
jgi:hypothetical protein